MQLRDIVDRLRLRGDQVRLRVLDHLNTMFDGPQRAIGIGQFVRGFLVQATRPGQSGNRVERGARPNGRIASAVDHLLDLDEELDLANAAAAALEVVSRAYHGPLREMVANPGGDLPHLVDHSEVKRAAPQERLDRGEEAL